MRIITTHCNNCDGMIFTSTTADTALSLLEFKRKLNKDGLWCKIVFIPVVDDERRLAVVNSLWTPSDGTRWASFIEHSLITAGDFAQEAVQW